MNEKASNQVPAECAKLYQNGLAILQQGDLNSAMASFTTALDIEPGFVDCRRALWDARRKAGTKKHGLWNKISTNGRLAPALAKAEALLHLKPLKTISIAERVLNQDPENTTARHLLARAALAANFPRTAVLALETLAADTPESSAIKRDLADALAKSGDTSAAAVILGQLLKDNPHDSQILRALGKLPQQTVMEQAGVPSPALPAVPILASPRLDHPAAETAEEDDNIIARFEPMMAHCSRNTKVLTTLAQAYSRKAMFDKSLAAYERALAIAGGTSPAIEKAIADVTLKKMQAELDRLKPATPEYEAMEERIRNWRLESKWRRLQASSGN